MERFGTGVSLGRFFGIGLLVLSGPFISLTSSLGAPSGYSTMSSVTSGRNLKISNRKFCLKVVAVA